MTLLAGVLAGNTTAQNMEAEPTYRTNVRRMTEEVAAYLANDLFAGYVEQVLTKTTESSA